MSCIVLDTNILVDANKDPRNPKDVASGHVVAAQAIVRSLIDGYATLGYSRGMIGEWEERGVLETCGRLFADLYEAGSMVELTPTRLTRGQVRDLAKYVDVDDQVFVLTAASINERKKSLGTRDPKTCREPSRTYVKKKFSVSVLLPDELLDQLGT